MYIMREVKGDCNMKQNTLNRSLIQAILKRAIHHIQENPEREMRNLIDLGKMFAKGQFQQEFFEAAGIELEKKNSLYYEIASRVVQKTDNEHLLTFGMNLGYNSLTSGAQQIRDFEDDAGFNIPWTIFITLSGNGKLNLPQLDRLITEGEEMGIFTYLIRVTKSFENQKELSRLFGRHANCAFVLFTEPDGLLSPGVVDTLGEPGNILVCLQMNGSEKSILTKASDRLRRANVLCAACYRAALGEQTGIKNAAHTAAELGYELLFTIHDYRFYLKHRDKMDRALREARLDLQLPILPFDIFSDVVMVDRNISSEGCLAVVDTGGELTVANAENGEVKQGFSVMQKPLPDILRTALRKTDA